MKRHTMRTTGVLTTMLEDQFWELVESTRLAPNETEQQAQMLQVVLMELGREKIIEFKIEFEKVLKRADTDELCAIYFLSYGYASDDGFAAFRSWLVAQGRKIFSDAVLDPKSVAPTLLTMKNLGIHADGGGEYFLYCADSAYEELFHEDIWDEIPEEINIEIMAHEFDQEKLLNLYPALCEIFNFAPYPREDENCPGE